MGTPEPIPRVAVADAVPREKSRAFLQPAKDGWRLGGVALQFVVAHRQLWRYVLVAAGAVLVSGAAVGALAVALRRHGGPVVDALAGLGAYYYFGVAITAASVGLGGLVASALDRRPVDSADGWRLIRRRRGAIAGWAAIDLAVGLPSRLIGSWALDQIIVVVLGFGWALVSFFVIPAIALTGDGAAAAARRSLRLMQRRWGDAVSGMVYIWLRAVVTFGLPGAALTAAGILLVIDRRVFLGGVLVSVGAGCIALALLLAAAARTVLAVVLFRYADTGTVTEPFPEQLLTRGLRAPGKLVRRFGRAVERKPVLELRRRILGAPEPDDTPPKPRDAGTDGE